MSCSFAVWQWCIIVVITMTECLPETDCWGIRSVIHALELFDVIRANFMASLKNSLDVAVGGPSNISNIGYDAANISFGHFFSIVRTVGSSNQRSFSP